MSKKDREPPAAPATAGKPGARHAAKVPLAAAATPATALRPSGRHAVKVPRETTAGAAIREVSRQQGIDELCEEFASVCESAVDPLEIASALEFDGMSDDAAQARHGFSDVFELADEMYMRVPRRPAEPEAASDPWQYSKFRPALHGLLYGLPALCFPAAIGLLTGPRVITALVVALLVAWSMSQGLAYLGYRRLGTTGVGEARRVLRAGMGAGLVVVLLALATTSLLAHSPMGVFWFGAGEGAYMLGACVLFVLGLGRWLLVALAPSVLGSALYLAFGRPPDLNHIAWLALAATPVLALVLAVAFTRTTGPSVGRLCTAADLRGALPAAGFGLAAAGLLAFPVAAGLHGDGGVNHGALLAALPISLSMGVGEWSLLWYRRRTQRLLRTTRELRTFTTKARLALLAAALQYAAGAVGLTLVAAAIAAVTGLLEPHWTYLPQIAAYLTLGVAMFLALTVQALGLRAFTLAACSVALAFEITFRHVGVPAQIIACGGLLVAVAGYAAAKLGKAVRHAY